MTEYDYSPEGYERYLETQNRVSNWVEEQTSRLHNHPRPYTRSISTPPSDPYHSSSRRPSHERTHHRSSSSSHDRRPEPHRSLTAAVDAIPRSIHSSQTRVPAQPIYYSNPAPVSHITPTTALPQGYSSGYRTYQFDGNSREIVIPRPRLGETYVIIPPTGRRVEVVTDASSRSSSKSSYRSPVTPTKKDQPLFKRLFTFGGPPSSKLGRSSTSSRRERTRSY